VQKSNIKNILVVNVNWVGDVIFSTPVFKALKKQYPEARLTCLGVPRVQEVLKCSPCVDDIIVYDEKGSHASPIGKLKIISELRKRKFDIVFLLHGSLTRALLVFLAGIPERVGYDTKKRGGLLTHKVELSVEWPHRSNYYLNVIESYGVKVDDRNYSLKVPEQAKSQIKEILEKQGVSSDDFLVVVNTGGNWDLKRWPRENFSNLISQLVKEFDVKVAIPGSKKDVPRVEEIAALSKVDLVNLTGKTDLKQLVALMQRANLVISADSGPLHIAGSVGTNTIALYGPTRPEVTGPLGQAESIIIQNDVGCNDNPCYFLECTKNICMQSITVEDVIQKVKEIRT